HVFRNLVLLNESLKPGVEPPFVVGTFIGRLGDNAGQEPEHLTSDGAPQVRPAQAVDQVCVGQGQIVRCKIRVDGLRFQLVEVGGINNTVGANLPNDEVAASATA